MAMPMRDALDDILDDLFPPSVRFATPLKFTALMRTAVEAAFKLADAGRFNMLGPGPSRHRSGFYPPPWPRQLRDRRNGPAERRVLTSLAGMSVAGKRFYLPGVYEIVSQSLYVSHVTPERRRGLGDRRSSINNP